VKECYGMYSYVGKKKLPDKPVRAGRIEGLWLVMHLLAGNELATSIHLLCLYKNETISLPRTNENKKGNGRNAQWGSRKIGFPFRLLSPGGDQATAMTGERKWTSDSGMVSSQPSFPLRKDCRDDKTKQRESREKGGGSL